LKEWEFKLIGGIDYYSDIFINLLFSVTWAKKEVGLLFGGLLFY